MFYSQKLIKTKNILLGIHTSGLWRTIKYKVELSFWTLKKKKKTENLNGLKISCSDIKFKEFFIKINYGLRKFFS